MELLLKALGLLGLLAGFVFGGRYLLNRYGSAGVSGKSGGGGNKKQPK